MTTVKQIERTWSSRQYDRLFHDLVALRPEASFHLDFEASRSVASATALAMVRMDELNQSHLPFYAQLLRTLLGTQDADGGWGDIVTTTLCVRALLCDAGHGDALEKALQYLANLQKTEGIWPKIPLRRMPHDAYVSAFVLFLLGDRQAFRNAIRFADALHWFEANYGNLEPESQRLWDRAKIRCGFHARAVSGGRFGEM